MSAVIQTARRLLVTGSAGFIGSHLLPVLRTEGGFCLRGLDRVANGSDYRADIRDRAALAAIAREFQPDTVIHLAALREVITPWSEVGELFSVNVDGAYNVADSMRPRLFLFASSSSVYGDGMPPRTLPLWDRIAPKSAYGISKANGELICDMWARETGNTAVAFRMGNIVGAAHGLLGYLAEHALRFPDGSEPARLRGGGRLIRDYVPLSHVLRSCVAALKGEWGRGCHTLNISSGVALSNGEVFDIVRTELKRLGYDINAEWSSAPAPYEAEAVVLEPHSMEELLGVARPSREEIIVAIQQAIEGAVTSLADAKLTATEAAPSIGHSAAGKTRNLQ